MIVYEERVPFAWVIERVRAARVARVEIMLIRNHNKGGGDNACEIEL